MRNLCLVGEKSFFDEEKKEVNLQYYLIEEQRDIKVESTLYGIKIVKNKRDCGKIFQEQEVAASLSYSRDFVKQMIVKMMRGMVTPITMMEIMDDLMSEEACSICHGIGS